MWTAQPDVPGGNGNYASIVFGSPQIWLFTNTDGTLNGDLQRYPFDGTQFTAPSDVLHITAPADKFIRTSAIVRGASGKLYGLLYTGDGYPTQAGYTPSAATSTDDGATWTWFGSCSPYGRNQSSGMALTVNEGATPVFRAWIDGVGGKLREMTSQDGWSWTDKGDMWPASLSSDNPLWPSACRTPTGTMLAVANGFPLVNMRVLWQPNGGAWRVLETDSVIKYGPKGTALAWDGAVIHAYNNSKHWTMPSP